MLSLQVDEAGIPLEFSIWLTEMGAQRPIESRNDFHFSKENFLSRLDGFAYLRQRLGDFSLTYDRFFQEVIENHRKEIELVSRARQDRELRVEASELVKKLKITGFRRWDSQSEDQLRDIGRLAYLPNGANFSVPGAGKTNALLALHALERIKRPSIRLLVVCPRNAMVSWDEEVRDCYGDEWEIVRLEGGKKKIELALEERPRISIISYQQVRGVVEQITRFMDAEPVHLVLDESHRIKAGANSLQGAASLELAAHAVRRDLLSGTPMPQGFSDLEAQFQFLWPSLSLFGGVPENVDPEQQIEMANKLIRPLFVRTTKRELGLKKPHLKYHPIEMSPEQSEIYDLLKSETARFFANLIPEDKDQLRKIGKQIMRILQFCSDPELLRNGLAPTERHGELYQRLSRCTHQPTAKANFLRAIVSGILASPGEKVVIWSTFVDQIERLVKVFEEYGATSIHGGIPTGSDSDLSFREGRLKRFKEDASCRVLVANPSACGEGISLHKTAHHAIYFDRSFNAAHFLQSIDRIHRRGLDKDIETYVHILVLRDTIEEAVRDRLSKKIESLQALLDDEDLSAMVFDPEDAEVFGEDQILDFSDIEAIRKAMGV